MKKKKKKNMVVSSLSFLLASYIQTWSWRSQWYGSANGSKEKKQQQQNLLFLAKK